MTISNRVHGWDNIKQCDQRGGAPRQMARSVVVLGLVLALGACALNPPQPPPADTPAARCLALYGKLDRAIAEAGGGGPSRPAPVHGFPYLRVDRFLASYRDQDLSGAALNAWLQRLADADLQARRIELQALPAQARAEIAGRYTDHPMSALQSCTDTLRAHDLANPARLALLRERAAMPSEYRVARQIIGLYPLTAIPISVGVRRYQAEVKATFAESMQALPVHGQLQRFAPPEPIPARLPIVTEDALGVPAPTAAQLEVLYAAHAPVWEVDVGGAYDMPGEPRWNGATPTVDASQPAVYRYPSYTRWQGRALLQLNYVIWFAERPLTGAFDILGGALDGVVWRVTLAEDGRVLTYDTVHPCGCYHMFFPSPALTLRPAALELAEPPLVPQSAPVLATNQRLIIRIASASHYVQRVYADPASGAAYRWRDYDELYAAPDPAAQGYRQLFGADGLVAGSERRERWLLWPMGIPSAGAMRERGRQATAFVGRRHFDDADLLDALFQPAKPVR
ncbi:MAG: hypothetical protein U1F68_10390 [Gammaproteobacteria bacterium]